MLYEFESELTATESAQCIDGVLGDDTDSAGMAKNLFSCFCTGDHDIEDWPLSSRPRGFNDEPLRHLDK